MLQNSELSPVSEDAELCTGVYLANMDKKHAHARVYDRELQASIMGTINKLAEL